METSFQWNAKTKVEFLKKLPSEARLAESLGFKPEKILVLYDSRLSKIEGIRKWLADYPYKYSLSAGEGLKDLANFTTHVKKIFKLASPFSNRSLCVVGLGGGSVGDFAGFLSSVLKRGVPLVHIPTTLLAAIDSAHGGKTALNVGEFKNQIGTFYPADSVLLVRSLFEELPSVQIQSASGELAKIAILAGGPLFNRFRDKFEMNLDTVWDFLPDVIEAKYKVVGKDPFEQTGERQVLNFGHSLGHALESYFSLPHGVAVGQGMLFALTWSEHQGYLRGNQADELTRLLREKTRFLQPKSFVREHKPMSRSRLSKLILEDKKLTDARHLTFIFLEQPGSPFRKVVPIESFLTETQRQGWTSL
jgi:3-dehydroquinate synthase